jgi:glutamate-1-semialdehyde 2,1-aminomutase
MTTLAKIIGGGFPVGAYGGRAEIMRLTDPTDGAPRVSHAGTFNGNPVTAAAGQVSLELLTPEAFARLEGAGRGLELAIRDAIEATGAPFSVNRAGSLLYLDLTGPAESEEWQAVAPAIRRRLPTAWLSHGLLGSAINATTVITDEQIAEVGRRFEAAMAELMQFLGEAVPATGAERAVASARPAVAAAAAG